MRDYAIATVSSQRQITIPQAIREQLGIKPGDKVSVAVADGMLVLSPIGNRGAETAGSVAKSVRRRR